MLLVLACSRCSVLHVFVSSKRCAEFVGWFVCHVCVVSFEYSSGNFGYSLDGSVILGLSVLGSLFESLCVSCSVCLWCLVNLLINFVGLLFLRNVLYS